MRPWFGIDWFRFALDVQVQSGGGKEGLQHEMSRSFVSPTTAVRQGDFRLLGRSPFASNNYGAQVKTLWPRE